MSIKRIKEEKKLNLDNRHEVEELLEDLNVVVHMINNTPGSNLVSIDLTTRGKILDFKIEYNIEHEEY